MVCVVCEVCEVFDDVVDPLHLIEPMNHYQILTLAIVLMFHVFDSEKFLLFKTKGEDS